MKTVLGVLALTLLHLHAMAQFNYRATVKDAETNETLPNANVVLGNQISVTDLEGHVVFNNLKKRKLCT